MFLKSLTYIGPSFFFFFFKFYGDHLDLHKLTHSFPTRRSSDLTLRGKKTIVVLSTGVDTSPAEKWQAIQQKLETSDVRILAVSLSGDFRKPIKHKVLSRQEKEDRAFVKQGFAEIARKRD